jgi:CRISPR/Cas system-associated exonuclease Cas4 (RecB family)
MQISQSFIKSFWSYLKGKECGIKIEAQFVHQIEFPPSDAMRLGQWFEYMCTGQKTKFGHTPVPDRLKPKKLTKKEIAEGKNQEDVVGELSKKYKDALIHVEVFKQMLKDYDYEIIGTGVTLEDKELGIKGDIDIVAQKRGTDKVVFIDTKFSGLLENKWDDLGWADESLSTKDKIMIQAVHYKLLGLATYGYEPDFFFWVFASNNTTDRKNIKVVVDEVKFQEHRVTIAKIREQWKKHYYDIGLKALPHPKRCGSCILSERCPAATSTPLEQTVHYG